MSPDPCPERPTDPVRSPSLRLDVTEAQERRAEALLSDYGSGAIRRRGRGL